MEAFLPERALILRPKTLLTDGWPEASQGAVKLDFVRESRMLFRKGGEVYFCFRAFAMLSLFGLCEFLWLWDAGLEIAWRVRGLELLC